MVLPHAAEGAAAHSSGVDTGGREIACQSGSQGCCIGLVNHVAVPGFSPAVQVQGCSSVESAYLVWRWGGQKFKVILVYTGYLKTPLPPKSTRL